mmetsp:Transcript_15760/g.39014  ORF Transcript_15760/g.39014 Transcript_15760/m.39014 type:complete len:316 (+) Transcript_15760:1752-2699(+)
MSSTDRSSTLFPPAPSSDPPPSPEASPASTSSTASPSRSSFRLAHPQIAWKISTEAPSWRKSWARLPLVRLPTAAKRGEIHRSSWVSTSARASTSSLTMRNISSASIFVLHLRCAKLSSAVPLCVAQRQFMSILCDSSSFSISADWHSHSTPSPLRGLMKFTSALFSTRYRTTFSRFCSTAAISGDLPRKSTTFTSASCSTSFRTTKSNPRRAAQPIGVIPNSTSAMSGEAFASSMLIISVTLFWNTIFSKTGNRRVLDDRAHTSGQVRRASSWKMSSSEVVADFSCSGIVPAKSSSAACSASRQSKCAIHRGVT